MELAPRTEDVTARPELARVREPLGPGELLTAELKGLGLRVKDIGYRVDGSGCRV